jgi:hypothetical protein
MRVICGTAAVKTPLPLKLTFRSISHLSPECFGVGQARFSRKSVKVPGIRHGTCYATRHRAARQARFDDGDERVTFGNTLT